MEEKRTKVGLIGVGQRLTVLLDILLEKCQTIDIIGIYDDSKEAIDYYKKFCFVDFFKTAQIYDDYNALMANPEIEWVLIASKNYLHAEHCISAFKAGKHVFCEKPMAISIPQCLAIRDAYLGSNKLFATGFVLRYSPFYKKIREIVSSGTLGKIISVEADELLAPSHGGYIMRNWRRFRDQSGPHLLEKCCHDIDILNWIIGSLPSKVASFGGLDIFTPENRPKVSEREITRRYCSWQAWEDVDAFNSEKDIEDNQVVIMEYRNKVRLTFHTNANSANPKRQMIICGLLGTLEADVMSGKMTLYRIFADNQGNYREELNTHGVGMHGGGDEMLVASLIQSMKTGLKPEIEGPEGFNSAVVCLACDEARQKQQVIDLEPYWEKFGLSNQN